jgi:hypothetical protein
VKKIPGDHDEIRIKADNAIDRLTKSEIDIDFTLVEAVLGNF